VSGADYALRSPNSLAWDACLIGKGSEEQRDVLFCLFNLTYPDLEDRDFTIVHEIVLGLKMLSLHDKIVQLKHSVSPPDTEFVNTLDTSGRSALHWAAMRQDSTSIETLLSLGADPNTSARNGRTPLMSACEVGDWLSVERLLLGGASLYPRTVDGWTALHFAARGKNDIRLVNLLLDKGALIDAKTASNATALVCALQSGKADIATQLIRRGASIDIAEVGGWTALHAAISSNDHQNIALLTQRVDATPRLDDGRSLLDVVWQFATVQTMKLLADLGLPASAIPTKDSDTRIDHDNLDTLENQAKLNAFRSLVDSLGVEDVYHDAHEVL